MNQVSMQRDRRQDAWSPSGNSLYAGPRFSQGAVNESGFARVGGEERRSSADGRSFIQHYGYGGGYSVRRTQGQTGGMIRRSPMFENNSFDKTNIETEAGNRAGGWIGAGNGIGPDVLCHSQYIGVTLQGSFLMHYGVKGQQWGVRRYIGEDGKWTSEGRARYYAEHPGGRRRAGTGVDTSGGTRRAVGIVQRSNGAGRVSKSITGNRGRNGNGQNSSMRMTKAELEAKQKRDEERRQRASTILKVTAGVALTAAIAYGGYKLYKGSTKLRDQTRQEIMKNFSADGKNINTMNGKYWNAADRRKYEQLMQERGKYLAENYTRRDAALSKFQEKTGIRINAPQSRAQVLRDRANENQYSNFIRDAENRAHQNRQIHDARERVRQAQKELDRYKNTAHIGTSKQYEALWTQRKQENVQAAKDNLTMLLQNRR